MIFGIEEEDLSDAIALLKIYGCEQTADKLMPNFYHTYHEKIDEIFKRYYSIVPEGDTQTLNLLDCLKKSLLSIPDIVLPER